jgi:prepilin-type processing-associated H-X9-DG protein
MYRPASPAFTLMEMLVVMSTISILLVLLMPAINGLKEAGRKAACLSSLHQLGTSFQLYCTDNGNTMGYYSDGSYWFTKLVVKGYANNTILTCPSDPAPYGSHPLPSVAKTSFGVVFRHIFPYTNNWQSINLSDHANRILFADAVNWGYFEVPMPSSNNKIAASPSSRHPSGVNVLWFDLHATTEKSLTDYNLNK